MPRYDALSRSSEQADRMTAAGLPYRERAAGSQGPQAFLQGMQGGQNIMRGMQDMQIRAQDAVMRQAQHEAEMQDVQLRSMALRNEIDLRMQLAPLAYQEKLMELETAKVTKQLEEFKLQQTDQSLNPRVVGNKKTGFKIRDGGRYVEVDENNPLHVALTYQYQQQLDSQSLDVMKARADISKTRAAAVRDLREPGATMNTATAGLAKTAAEMHRAARSDYNEIAGKGFPEEEALKAKMDYWEARAKELVGSQSGEKSADMVMVDSTAKELGVSPESASGAIRALADLLGESPNQIMERMIVFPDEAEQLKQVLKMLAKVREENR